MAASFQPQDELLTERRRWDGMMGAWGHGSFANDDAADWLADYESNGIAAVVSALEAVCSLAENDYLEAPEASAAVAAAEMVAAALDSDKSGLSEEARSLFSNHQHELANPRLGHLAQRAVARVLAQSELKELWQESLVQGRPESKLWFALMDALASRLQTRR